jgi:hypothetical protein
MGQNYINFGKEKGQCEKTLLIYRTHQKTTALIGERPFLHFYLGIVNYFALAGKVKVLVCCVFDINI